ncbi:MAG: type II secretion system protein [Candidatus Saccharibacteria bacterium]|nr:type II secretion system protein [Candidatus Saccharibacteria bacterium]
MNISKILRSISSFINKKNTNKTKLDNPQISGFTIVEVMIVLAIAGLILAVVFIAVPALQRNQRNSARQNDVAYIKAQLNQLVANNGNRLPQASGIKGILKSEELNYLGGGVAIDVKDIKAAAVNVVNTNGYFHYTPDGTFHGTLTDELLVPTTDLDIVVLVAKKTCGTSNIVSSVAAGYDVTTLTAATGSRNNIAILYTLEGDTNVYCDDTTL